MAQSKYHRRDRQHEHASQQAGANSLSASEHNEQPQDDADEALQAFFAANDDNPNEC